MDFSPIAQNSYDIVKNSDRPYKVEPSIKLIQKGSEERGKMKKSLIKNSIIVSNSEPGMLFQKLKI